MEVRRRLLLQMGANSMVGIKQIKLQPSDGYEMIIPVPERPYGFLIAADNETQNGSTVIRVSGIWTTYNGGIYAGGRWVSVLNNGSQDHWALSASNLYYDETNHELHVKVNSGYFRSDRNYYMWYFTMPF